MGYGEQIRSVTQESDQTLLEFVSVACLTFPDCENVPAEAFEFATIGGIPRLVPLKLLTPECQPCPGGAAPVLATMSMPEAAMYKDDFATRWKNEVGTAREAPSLQPVAISEAVYKAANCKFRLRMCAMNSRHAAAALRGRQIIHCSLTQLAQSPRQDRTRWRAVFRLAVVRPDTQFHVL